MTRNVVLAVAVIFGLSGVGTTTHAQDSVLAELYGQGVHSYFANQHFEAHESLNTAIEQGSQDPRCYFFRGLTRLRLGRTEEAKADFRSGAKLEATGRDRVYPVGQSLQRVQGRDRLTLEVERRSARLAARIDAMKAKKQRYEGLQRAEEEVVRDPNRQPPANAAEVVGTLAADPSDPFTGNEEETPEPALPRAVPSGTPSPTPTPDATPAPAETPMPEAADDPFGGGATPPAADDPFGGATPPADDPFGDTPTDTPPATPAADDPFGGDTPAETPADDPFGGDTPAETPADDPFGGDTPAETPPAGDPFADDPFGN